MSGAVSVDELIAYMSDIELSSGQRLAAKLVLDGVEGQVRRFINRPILPTAVTEAPEVSADGLLLTRHTPVLSLTPVEGVELRDGLLYSTGWGTAPSISYVAGLEADDLNAVKLEILRIAAREMTNKHDDIQGNSGVGRGEDAKPEPEGLTEDDRKQLRPFRRRVVVRGGGRL